jgi:CO dehydrogenase maturation factor
MPKVIAIAGKGGVGKTTIGGMLVRYIVEEMKKGPVLAVDADPNSNLNELLGIKVKETIGRVRETMKKDVPAGMTKDIWFEYKVNEAVIEGTGFDLLVMGRPEGPGCYCAANSLAKQSIDSLKENYTYVVVDNEAGMEHMSRLVTQNVGILYVVSDPTPRGLLTAGRIMELIKELNLNIHKTYTVVNRIREEEIGALRQIGKQKGIEIIGTIRNDEMLVKNDRDEESIFILDRDSLALTDAYSIFKRTMD